MTTNVDKTVQKPEERRWTPEQQTAIDVRDKTLLVSAAAGSGKTAVLTERIIRTLTEGDSPADISELLVVTFTNAAAAEMRERISAAIKRAIANDPTNRHLERQLMLLPMARIRTIDSFCNEILKNNSERVGVSPNYRIGDAAEQQLLAFSVLEGMINAIYDGRLSEVASAEDFEALADCLTDSKRMGMLAEVFYKIYEGFESAEEGVYALRSLAQKYLPEGFTTPEQTPYGELFVERAHELAEHFTKVYKSDISELSVGSAEEIAYIDSLHADIARLSMIREAESYTAISELLELKAATLPRKKSGTELTSLQELVREHRSACSDAIRALKKPFSFTVEDWKYLYSGLYSRLLVLCRFIERFDMLYMAEKRARAMFGYHDVERFVYECLWSDGERTDVAEALSQELRAVYIDEYQDVNALQNKIFEAISREDNRFMVGDIKQSIYSFRSAEPDIFARMKRSFPIYSESDDSPCASVFMSSNFRCDEGIVNFVNGIFDKVFSVIGESIGYADGDKLEFAKGSIPGVITGDFLPEVLVAHDPGTSADEGERSSVLPTLVAERIRELIDGGRLNDGSPIRPKDIAIIMRNAKGRAADYAQALLNAGVAARIGEEKNFFLNREILLTLCLLNTIDNPRRDIYLAGLLRSPIFDFSADELYLIANENKRGCLYESLTAYVEAHPDFKKGERFLSVLNGYRDAAEGVGADVLIYRLYHETGLLALASKNGGLDNLTVLYNYARSFEAGSYKGLYAFISFINTVIERRSEFRAAKESADADEVNIITVHTSKGLEYPIVFFVDASRQIHRQGNMDPSKITCQEGFGVSFCLRTPSGLGVVESPVDMAVKEYGKQRRHEEEMRVLYVALTRARERLFVVGSTTDDPDEYIERIKDESDHLTRYSIKKMQTFLDIILATAPPATVKTVGSVSVGCEDCDAEEEVLKTVSAVDSYDAEPAVFDGDELRARLSYRYPREHLCTLPEKMSVSRLYPTVLDGVDESAEVLPPAKKGGSSGRLPAFMTGTPTDESAKRGIATHLFMQFCDLARVLEHGTDRELERLCKSGFISEKDKDRVRRDEIAKFASSELLRSMLAAKGLHRELRFNVRLPAELFTEDEALRGELAGEKILVQGVIDCIIENADGSLRLIDYKTDRLSREELDDPELAKAVLAKKHSLQLYYYSLAVESIFGKKPSAVEVYSLPLGRTIRIL